MEEFMNRLLALRQTSDPIMDAKREKNRASAIEIYGSPEAYEKNLQENPLPPTLGEAMGNFFKRILNARGN